MNYDLAVFNYNSEVYKFTYAVSEGPAANGGM
jgi:hypothetical protein